MVDPRIARTRTHVLTVLNQLLQVPGNQITLSTLADAAQVSRRTIYTHWGTVEAAVADAEFGIEPSAERDTFTAIAADTMRSLPDMVRELEQLRRDSPQKV